MQKLNGILLRIGNALGLLVVTFGVLRFACCESVGGLLIALAIIIAGPLEDILTNLAVSKGQTEQEKQELAQLVDLSTSIAFLLCLGVAVWTR